MPLTDAQKMQVRRHLKYPVIGLPSITPGGASLGVGYTGYRFFQAWGLLEYRLNNLQPVEEAAVLGNPVGGVAIVGPQPNVGDTVSVTITSTSLVSPVTVTTPPFAADGSDGRLTFCQQIAAGVSSSAPLSIAGFLAYTPYGTGPFSQNAIPLPEVGIESPSLFTLSATGSGAIFPQITSQGVFVAPSTSLDGGATTIYGYINILNGLEFSYATASDNLDTAKADVWTARSNELGLRRSLYEHWVAMFSDFVGVPVNPDRRRANDASHFGALRFA